jgi:hypothetical protein
VTLGGWIFLTIAWGLVIAMAGYGVYRTWTDD